MICLLEVRQMRQHRRRVGRGHDLRERRGADVGARLERRARVLGDDRVAVGDGDVLAQLDDGKGEAHRRRDREQSDAKDDRGDPAQQAAVLLRPHELADGVGDFVQVELRGGGGAGGGEGVGIGWRAAATAAVLLPPAPPRCRPCPSP